jgi:ADP-heptose:LPS heptosyltransferase
MRLRLPSGEQLLYAANILANNLFFSRRPQKIPQTILVVKWDEIGDMATAVHCFEALKMTYPSAKLTVLCKPFVRSLIMHDPFIDHILTDIREFNRSYDLVVELRGTWSTLYRAMIHKAGFRVSRAEVRLRNKGKQKHEIQTNLEVIEPITGKLTDLKPVLYFSEDERRQVQEFLEKRHVGRFAILHAGARRKLRQWDLDKFAVAATYLHDAYGLDILFAGSAEDLPDIRKIQSQLAFTSHDITDGFSLSAFSACCSQASFYLGNESGPMHIASAFALPLIGLFGPGVPHVFYPIGEKVRVLHHILPCNPCDQIHCVHPENPCISRIAANDVLEKIDEIMAE